MSTLKDISLRKYISESISHGYMYNVTRNSLFDRSFLSASVYWFTLEIVFYITSVQL